mgnify:CR=1 FL=1
MDNRINANACGIPFSRPITASCLAACLLTTTGCVDRPKPQTERNSAMVNNLAPLWQTNGGDPSLPSATEALRGRAFEAVEPSPTF